VQLPTVAAELEAAGILAKFSWNLAVAFRARCG